MGFWTRRSSVIHFFRLSSFHYVFSTGRKFLHCFSSVRTFLGFLFFCPYISWLPFLLSVHLLAAFPTVRTSFGCLSYCRTSLGCLHCCSYDRSLGYTLSNYIICVNCLDQLYSLASPALCIAWFPVSIKFACKALKKLDPPNPALM